MDGQVTYKIIPIFLLQRTLKFLAHRFNSLYFVGVFIYAGCSSFPQDSELKNSPDRIHPNILFLLADDWSYPHAGAYGDSVISTPTFDYIAEQGALFYNAFCTAPSCTPSRGSILTGRYPHQLEEGMNLHGFLPNKFPNYVTLLQESGYQVGFEKKGWGPGNFEEGGYSHNPAGQEYENFQIFLDSLPKNKPFCYWFGSNDPHRAYSPDSVTKTPEILSKVTVPAWLPNTDSVKGDILDYYFEVERFDKNCGQILTLLKTNNLLSNTIVIMTSDNGMPFPRSKANLYDAGTRMPLAIYWENHIKPATAITDFVSFIDFAPTFLDAASIDIPVEITGKSLIPLLTTGKDSIERKQVFFERERHAYVRKGNVSYPSRGIRTENYLYVLNLLPDRWPAGDPDLVFSVGSFGDVDASPSKEYILNHAQETAIRPLYEAAFAKRPAEELYDLHQDPSQLSNLVNQPEYATTLHQLRQHMKNWMESTQDPDLTENIPADTYPYFGKGKPNN